MCKIEWLLCPVCGSKTWIKLRPDTVLENFPLFCPKCKKESLITVRKLHTTVITEPITRSGSEKKRAAAISDFQVQLPSMGAALFLYPFTIPLHNSLRFVV